MIFTLCRLELAFNGFGYEDAGYEQKQGIGVGLNKCLLDNKKKFNWVSHTWTHQHLDWLNAPNCDGEESMYFLVCNFIIGHP